MNETPEHNNSRLKVNKPIDQPSTFSPDAELHFHQSKQSLLQAEDYVSGILKGNRTILSKAITLVESTLPKHQAIAQEIIESCLPHSGNSLRVGVTGVPGVGKSTFIEALGINLIKAGSTLAVLAIDPSSQRTKGSILGDKTRMENLSMEPNAFIRPSPSAGSLGGVTRKTKEIIILCEAAGFDIIIVETVGVGQSETAVHSMVDFFLLLMLAGAGDELQGIKRGIMEMADMLVINKADGDNVKKANLSKQEYLNAMHLFPATESGWVPTVKTCSSLNNTGIKEVWDSILLYKEQTQRNGYFQTRRQEQELKIFTESIGHQLTDHFFQNTAVLKKLNEIKADVLNGKKSAYLAGSELLEIYYKSLKND